MKTKQITILLGLGLLLSVSQVNAQYYADELVNSGPCKPITLSCGSGVENAANAVDHVGSTYASMYTIIGVDNISYLRVGFSHDVPGGSKIGVYIQEGSVILNADVLESIEVRVYDDNGNIVGKKTKFKTADLQLLSGGGNLNVLPVTTEEGSYNINEVKITLKGLVSVLNNIRVYGVAEVSDCPSLKATSVFAKGPCDPIVPILCPGGVLNADNAVSAADGDYATLSIPLGIGGTAYLDLAFETGGNDGDRVSFLIGQNNTLLDAALLENLSITVYDQNGNIVKKKTKFKLADLETSLLDPNRSTIGVTTGHGDYTIAHAKITLTSLVSVLSDLRVYRATSKESTNFDAKVTPDGPLTFCEGGKVKLTAAANDENTFQWYKDNEAIPGATNKKYTAKSQGGYYMYRVGPAGCGALSFTTDVIVNCKNGVAMNQSTLAYPNPFSDHFQLALGEPSTQDAFISISDISGRMLSIAPWTGAGNLELGSDLKGGVYIVQLYDGINSSYSKVIKVE